MGKTSRTEELIRILSDKHLQIDKGSHEVLCHGNTLMGLPLYVRILPAHSRARFYVSWPCQTGKRDISIDVGYENEIPLVEMVETVLNSLINEINKLIESN